MYIGCASRLHRTDHIVLDARRHFVQRTPAQRERLIEPPSDLCR